MPVDSSYMTFEFPAEIEQLSDTITGYESLHKYSIDNRELFWGTLAKTRLQWFKEFDEITSGSFQDPEAKIKWFINGKLNVSGDLTNYFIIFLAYCC